MSDQLDKILDRITELSIQTGKIEARLEMVQAQIEFIKEEDARQNELLAEHIAGVKTQAARLDVEIQQRNLAIKSHEEHSQSRYMGISKRLESVEFFPNFIKSAIIVLKWAGIAATAIVAITKLLGMW